MSVGITPINVMQKIKVMCFIGGEFKFIDDKMACESPEKNVICWGASNTPPQKIKGFLYSGKIWYICWLGAGNHPLGLPCCRVETCLKPVVTTWFIYTYYISILRQSLIVAAPKSMIKTESDFLTCFLQENHSTITKQ